MQAGPVVLPVMGRDQQGEPRIVLLRLFEQTPFRLELLARVGKGTGEERRGIAQTDFQQVPGPGHLHHAIEEKSRGFGTHFRFEQLLGFF